MLRCAVALVPVLSRKDKIVYRFKGFDSSLCGDNMAALEAMVNAWMEGECPRIRQMCQSIRGQHILLSFVYEDIRELGKSHFNADPGDRHYAGPFRVYLTTTRLMTDQPAPVFRPLPPRCSKIHTQYHS